MPNQGGNNNPEGIGGKSGKVCQVDNINLTIDEDKPKGGTSPSYIAKRLKRDNPELFSKVASGRFIFIPGYQVGTP